MEWSSLVKMAADLPRTAEQWEVLRGPGPVYRDESGQPVIAEVILVVSTDGNVVAAQAVESEPEADMLGTFVTMTCLRPQNGEPRRPLVVVTAEEDNMAGLAEAMQAIGIVLRHGATEMAERAYLELMSSLMRHEEHGSLAESEDIDIREYFKTAAAFYRARPWEAFPAGKYVGFRLDGGPWRYATIMGQGNEEFGLGGFDSWLDVCRFSYHHFAEAYGRSADGEPDMLGSIAGLEGVSLYSLDEASPDDAAIIERLRIRPTWKGKYALLDRFTSGGPDTPENDLETWTSVMQVLTQRVERARGKKVSSITAQVDTIDGPLEVRFPARGDEDESADEYYELNFAYRIMPKGGGDLLLARATVVAPASAKWPQVLKALRADARESGRYSDYYLDHLHEPDFGYLLWFGHGSAVEPSPTVGQMAGLKSVSVESGRTESQIAFRRVDGTEENGIRAWWTAE